MGSLKRIRVLLADDHPVVREGVRSCLANCRQIKVVGEAANGTELVEKVKTLHPDVALVDINLPQLNGLRATEQLSREAPATKVLALSAHQNQDYVQGMLQAGAKGYVMKEASPSELIEAIQTVQRGQRFFSPCVMQELVDSLGKQKARTKPLPASRLSARERQVLALIAEGLGNKHIAEKLSISESTVGTHRERLMDKLQLHKVASLTRYAVAHGLVSAG
jgi:DNA-binding NarL/FixJ family response regulator